MANCTPKQVTFRVTQMRFVIGPVEYDADLTVQFGSQVYHFHATVPAETPELTGFVVAPDFNETVSASGQLLVAFSVSPDPATVTAGQGFYDGSWSVEVVDDDGALWYEKVDSNGLDVLLTPCDHTWCDASKLLSKPMAGTAHESTVFRLCVGEPMTAGVFDEDGICCAGTTDEGDPCGGPGQPPCPPPGCGGPGEPPCPPGCGGAGQPPCEPPPPGCGGPGQPPCVPPPTGEEIANACLCRREFITCLYPMPTEEGASRMIAGTRTRLYVSNSDGNWQIVRTMTALCCTEAALEEDFVPDGRFRVTTLGNILFAAHSEAGMYTWAPGNLFYKEQDQLYHSAAPVDDLIAFDITQARAVAQVLGFIFIGNVVEEGRRKPGLVLWSDYNDPNRWSRTGESLAGRVDFGNGEEILNIVSFHRGLRIFTRSSIWAGVLVESAEVWRFERIYDGSDGKNSVLAFPNAVTQNDDILVFLGYRQILLLAPTDRSPRALEWLDQAGRVIYDGVQDRWLESLPEGIMKVRREIDTSASWIPIAGSYSVDRMSLFFWASESSPGIPDTGIAIDPRSRTVSLLDFGATAAATYSPSYRITLRRWLANEGICSPEPDINEGNPEIAFAQKSYPYLVHPGESTGKFPEFDLRGVDVAEVAPEGWYADMVAGGRCCVMCPPRSATAKTVLADAGDKVLKELLPDYFARQMVLNFTFETWPEENADTSESGKIKSSDPYHPTLILDLEDETDVVKRNFAWLWQSDVTNMGIANEKTLRDFQVTYESFIPGDQADAVDCGVDLTTVWVCRMQAGASNQTSCVRWRDDDPLPITCRTNEPPYPLERPEYDGGPESMVFRFLENGTYVAFRIFGGGTDPEVAAVGPFAISGISLFVESTRSTW